MNKSDRKGRCEVALYTALPALPDPLFKSTPAFFSHSPLLFFFPGYTRTPITYIRGVRGGGGSEVRMWDCNISNDSFTRFRWPADVFIGFRAKLI